MSPTEQQVLDALRQVIDPELGLNVVDLGLVYGVRIQGTQVHVELTMTTAACPMSEQIVEEAEFSLRYVPGVTEAAVELVWDPPWGPERMSDRAREILGWT